MSVIMESNMSSEKTGFFSRAFQKVNPKYAEAFKLDSIERNLRKFSILPYFNIITQLACIFIYLYVYPIAFPEKPKLDAPFFLLFSGLYVLGNIAFLVIFSILKKRQNKPNFMRIATILLHAFIICYAITESVQVVFELEISGNIYRFLATFFVVAFFPTIGRISKSIYMILYIVISEMVIAYLRNRGVMVYSYAEIMGLFLVVCLIASNIYYSSSITTFELKMDLIQSNNALEVANQKLATLSVTDPLTGLSNRRAFSDHIENCWRTALRSNGPVGLLIIDIDNFKKYNDTYGHQAGDICLQRVASSISDQFNRSIDMVCRYGGEEFAVVLSHVSLENSAALAEQVRKEVENIAIPHKKNLPSGVVTVSIGVATFVPTIDETYDDLIRMADDALYQAKSDGRNRVYIREQK